MSMVDSSKPQTRSIPQWQKQERTKYSPDPSSSARAQEPPATQALLIEQASIWLDDDGIRDASTERKISFLESKGLSNDSIHKLLGVSPNKDAAPSPSEPTPATERSRAPLQQRQSSQPKDRDIPPVITYPEFLLHAQKSPPLITANRLLNTLYLASGAAATIYATSKYVVYPMVESLTEARHSLFETASTNVNNLNEKLEKVVSVIPDTKSTSKAKGTSIGDETSDLDSVTSDPAELFHRDTGTQTSLSLSRSSSAVSSSRSDSASSPEASPAAAQSSSLKSIREQLSSTLESTTTSREIDESVMDDMKSLHHYLDLLAYGGNATYVNGYPSAGSGKDDEIARFKAEIRGVKGVLLNARSFPGSGRGRATVER